MKTSRIILTSFSLMFIVIAFIFTSCKKTEEPAQQQNTGVVKTEVVDMRTLFEMPDPPGALECDYPAGNCLPTTTIRPKDRSLEKSFRIYTDFITKYKNNKVNEFFQESNYLELFPALINMPDVVNGLQNSEIILYHQKSSFDGFDYYIGLNKGTDFSSTWIGKQKCVFVIDYQLK